MRNGISATSHLDNVSSTLSISEDSTSCTPATTPSSFVSSQTVQASPFHTQIEYGILLVRLRRMEILPLCGRRQRNDWFLFPNSRNFMPRDCLENIIDSGLQQRRILFEWSQIMCCQLVLAQGWVRSFSTQFWMNIRPTSQVFVTKLERGN